MVPPRQSPRSKRQAQTTNKPVKKAYSRRSDSLSEVPSDALDRKQPRLSFTSAPRHSGWTASSSASNQRSSNGASSSTLVNLGASLSAAAISKHESSPTEGLKDSKPFQERSGNQQDLKGKAPAEPREQFEGAESLWSERYGPKSRGELAVQPRKVADVEGWLRDAFEGSPVTKRHRRMLALTGPSGSGKTQVIRTLSDKDQLDFEIIEWVSDGSQPGFDPNSDQVSFMEGYVPLIRRFEEFLTKAARFSSLSFSQTPEGASSTSLQSSTQAAPCRRRVILVEDLPNITHSATKHAFRAALEMFIYRPLPAGQHTPLILIVSDVTPRLDAEAWLTSGNASWKDRSSATLGLRELVNEQVRHNPAFAEIRFNPIAKTLLAQVISRHLDAGPSPRKGRKTQVKTARKQFADAIAQEAGGDIRTAWNLVQLAGSSDNVLPSLSQRGTKRHSDGSEISTSSPQRASNDRESQEYRISAVTGREHSLALFHALGRILYNKRIGDPGETSGLSKTAYDSSQGGQSTRLATESSRSVCEIWELPPSLACRERAPSKVDVNALWTEVPVDTPMLQLYLHQNYPPFCDDVEQCDLILEGLSFADTGLKTESEEWLHANLSSHYSFLTTVHATLLALPSPITRRGQKFSKSCFFEMRSRNLELQGALEDARAWLGLRTTLGHVSDPELLTEIVPYIWRIKGSRVQDGETRLLAAQTSRGALGDAAHTVPPCIRSIGEIRLENSSTSSWQGEQLDEADGAEEDKAEFIDAPALPRGPRRRTSQSNHDSDRA
ncbi:Checkpoint RAD17-RFC complex, RAD17/RAD24 component [Ceraceosorus bombacis]|uniref:Checkpoint RAD17-RFC complex, RAD17/RAD24 component n=1 Tax=Ceraceosorus bombacis TaxID=401625 RepID=A0A0P1BI93_9BASI|nr:Checkpoint RAD17-RFC complex, RAD17/RAD24 component [Ceraceosorus bombacis]